MLNYQKTGDFIREERKKLNFSQEQLGNLLYVTRQAVSKWECGKCMPDCNSLLELSKIFSVSLDEIILGNRKQKKSKKKAVWSL